MIRSESSAKATSEVAASASSTGARLPAAGRPRKEDHAVGVPWNVVEGADHQGLRPALLACQRHRGPQALVELAAKLLDEPLLVLAHVEVALSYEDLAVTGLHA